MLSKTSIEEEKTTSVDKIGGSKSKMDEYFHIIETDNDVYSITLSLKSIVDRHHFSDADKQRIHVCALEMTKNVLRHSGSKGRFSCYTIEDVGIIMKIEDFGRGIANIDELLNGEKVEGTKGLGLGLVGSKRLMDQFFVHTSDKGTQIIAVKWMTNLKVLVK